MNTGAKTRFQELVETVGKLEVTVLASSRFPSLDIEKHLDVDELRAVVFNAGDSGSDRALEHIKQCQACERMVRDEQWDNPLIEEDDGEPS